MEKSKNNQHGSTLDEVFLAVKTLSVKTDEQFGIINERFGTIDERFEIINERFGAIDKRFEIINEQFGTIDKRFGIIDERFMATDKKISGLGGLVHDVLVTVNDFAGQTERQFIGIESKMATKDDLINLEGKMATRLVTKDYLDDKLADRTVEIFQRLDRWPSKDRNFKEKLVGVISGHSLITKSETDNLRELI